MPTRTPQEVAAVVTADIAGYKKAMRESVRETAKWEADTKRHLTQHERATTKMGVVERRVVADTTRAIRQNSAERHRAAEQAIRDDSRRIQSIARTAAAEQRRGLSGLRQGMVSRGGGMIRGVLGAAGVMGGMSLIQDIKNFEAAITDLQITGDKTDSWADSTRQAVLSVSNATGKGKAEVVSYLKAIIEQTGDADYAIQTLKQMGDVAVATGANMGDLGSMAVKMGGSMRLAAREVYPAMGILRQQEKLGSFTMGNIAGSWGKVSGFASSLGAGGKGVAGVTAIGGLLQMAARTGSVDAPEETATSAARFLERLGRNPQKIEKALGMAKGTLGVMGKTKKGKTEFEFKALSDVFRAIGEAGAKNPGKFAKAGITLFGQMGIKTAIALRDAAAAGWENKVGKFAAASDVFGVTAQQGVKALGDDLAKRKESAAFKFEQALARISNLFQERGLKVMHAIADGLPKMLKVLEFIIDNSRTLFALWLGAKGLAFFKTLGLGGGGAPEGGGAPGTPWHKRGSGAGGGMNMLGVGMTSLALAPLAVDLGVRIGEAFAGTSMAKIKQAFADIEEQGRLTATLKGKREVVDSWRKSGWSKDWAGMTTEGSGAFVDLETTLGQFGAWKSLPGGKAGYESSAGAIQGKYGVGGTSSLIQNLQNKYDVVAEAARKDFEEKFGAGTGAALTNRAIEADSPQMAALGKLIEELSESNRLASKGRKISVKPNIIVNVGGDRPGGRVRAASMPSYREQDLSDDPGIIGGTGEELFGVPVSSALPTGGGL